MPPSPTNPVVKAIGDINIEGHVIPHTWYLTKLLRIDPTKPAYYEEEDATTGAKTLKVNKINLNAVVILSDIVFWYRPKKVVDEVTGQLVEITKRFKADKLQKSYKSWAAQFGLTVRQVKDACYFLRDRGLITVECRNITTANGQTIPNVTFFEPVPEKIREITDFTSAKKNKIPTEEELEGCTLERMMVPESEESDGGHTLQSAPSYVETDDTVRSDVRHHTLERNNTKTTTEITTETTNTDGVFDDPSGTSSALVKVEDKTLPPMEARLEKFDQYKVYSDENGKLYKEQQYTTKSNKLAIRKVYLSKTEIREFKGGDYEDTQKLLANADQYGATHKALIDFITKLLMEEGRELPSKVVMRETKGARECRKLIGQGVFTLKDLSELLVFAVKEKLMDVSLTSIASVATSYMARKRMNGGKPVHSRFRTAQERSEETMKNRNYDQIHDMAEGMYEKFRIEKKK